jgi:tRNA pseudouridine55 synthase
MARRRKGNKINGWINLDKPLSVTSTQAVGKIRRALNAQKIGHGGTLDPLATGVLPIALGEATKTIQFCQDHLKTYSFEVMWGEERDTDDAEGIIINSCNIYPNEEEISGVIKSFTGEIEQIPPQYSAIKIDGKRAYDIARSGQKADIKPRNVYIKSLELIKANDKHASFRTICGKGTYIRSLARDMARSMGTFGYITKLHREAVGPFNIKNSISLDIFEDLEHIPALDDVLLPVEAMLDDIPAIDLNEMEAMRLKNGQALSFISRPDAERLQKAGLSLRGEAPTTALAVCDYKAVAIVNVEGSKIQPVRVLNI